MRRSERALGFEHGRHGVLVMAVEERLGERGHPFPVPFDVLGGDGQLGRDGRAHHSSLPEASGEFVAALARRCR